MIEHFRDRQHAGQILAERLRAYAGRPNVVVLGLARGGVPVASEVARALGAPLDVFVVRKVGVPHHEELAMGAIASGGVRVLNQDVVSSLRIDPLVLQNRIQAEEHELTKRENLYRRGRPALDLTEHVVVIVDDGLATGSTMRAAIQAVRDHHPSQVVVGVPVAAPSVCESLGSLADAVICVATPRNLHAVGQWYEDFSQTSDEEVADLLGMNDA